MTKTSTMNGLLAVFIMLALMAGCVGDEPSHKDDGSRIVCDKLTGKLLVTGSSTMAPMVAEIAKRFTLLHPGVQIDVQAGGSVRGLNDLRKGISDIGMVSRALKEKEDDLLGFPIARDGICLIVNRDNPIETLSDQQIVGIYTGTINNWKNVGGRDSPIVALIRPPQRPSLELFIHYFNIKESDIKAYATVGDNQEAIKAVADNRGAIVPVSVGEAERDSAHGVPIKSLPVDGVAAKIQNVRNGNFPISRSLSLVIREPPAGLTRAFIDFALSAQVTDIARTYDFVPYLD